MKISQKLIYDEAYKKEYLLMCSILFQKANREDDCKNCIDFLEEFIEHDKEDISFLNIFYNIYIEINKKAKTNLNKCLEFIKSIQKKNPNNLEFKQRFQSYKIEIKNLLENININNIEKFNSSQTNSNKFKNILKSI